MPSMSDWMGAGLINYMNLTAPDPYFPRLQRSVEVTTAEHMSKFCYVLQKKMQKESGKGAWTFAGQETTAPEFFSSKTMVQSKRWEKRSSQESKAKRQQLLTQMSNLEISQQDFHVAIADLNLHSEEISLPWYSYAMMPNQVHDYVVSLSNIDHQNQFFSQSANRERGQHQPGAVSTRTAHSLAALPNHGHVRGRDFYPNVVGMIAEDIAPPPEQGGILAKHLGM